jgi:threonine aldolase
LNRLEQRAAEIVGKEAAVFVPTGTMGNTVAIKAHTQHGQEVICEARSHVFNYELAMMAWFAGCVARPIAVEDGILTWNQIRPAIKALGPHWAPTGLIEIENTHNMAGGTVYPQEVIDEICDEAHETGLNVHMDGARVFNASAATGIPVRRIVEKVDTVMFCLSKGLGAPVGSMLAGTADAIERGRLFRKRLGGGMRQAGVLAAAGLIALEEMPARLTVDHDNAKHLASALSTFPGISIQPEKVETNIVIFDVAGTGMSGAEFSAALKSRGVLMNAVGPTRIRAVTHCDVDRAACSQALTAIEEVAAARVV